MLWMIYLILNAVSFKNHLNGNSNEIVLFDVVVTNINTENGDDFACIRASIKQGREKCLAFPGLWLTFVLIYIYTYTFPLKMRTNRMALLELPLFISWCWAFRSYFITLITLYGCMAMVVVVFDYLLPHEFLWITQLYSLFKLASQRHRIDFIGKRKANKGSTEFSQILLWNMNQRNNHFIFFFIKVLLKYT